MQRGRIAGLRVAPVLLGVSCGAPLSMFSTATESVERVSRLTWFMIGLSGTIFVGVMAVMVIAAIRHRRRDPAAVDLSERGVGWIVWGGAVMPAGVLVAVFVVSLVAMGRVSHARPAVTIHVTGFQWWWQVDYELPGGARAFRTANEIHIPVDRPVRILLTSGDVIHSFWVPQLQGKLDAIPGDTNDLRVTARRKGRYLGVCAEYCGMQHAHMELIVVVDDSASFARWFAHQRSDGIVPRDPVAIEGRRLFANGPCMACHTVRGTSKVGETGPDLTHVGSRLMLAAGTLPNTLGDLEGWIANPQALKPGTKMPVVTVYSGDELRALATYLAGLR